MNHGSLFSGIGGFDLAAEWMGWENMFHCEWNEFGQQNLKYYWPNAVSYDDICKTDFTIWRGKIDILTGGFPCQPYSMAGKRKGTEDSRHLWPEMLRAIRECRPAWVVGENVPGIINWSGGLVFEQVCADLEGEGYEVQPVVLPACGVNAPHRRDRVWFVAYSERWGLQRRNGQAQERQRKATDRSVPSLVENKDWEAHARSSIHSTSYGIPGRLGSITFSKWRNESIKAGGNAIVPQVAFQIFKVIEKMSQNILQEKEQTKAL